MRKVLFMLALCSTVLACQDDVKIAEVESWEVATIKVGIGEDSRVVCNELSSSFEAGDEIGVFGKYVDNAKFVVDEGANNATSDGKILVEQGEKLFAYYPYNAEVTKDHTSTVGIRARALSIEVPTRQTQTDAIGSHVVQYDCMVAIPTTVSDKTPQIMFNRMNTWLEFKICNEGQESIAVKSVTIESEEGELLVNGKVDVLAETGEFYMYVNPISGTKKLVVTTQGEWTTIEPGNNATVKASILPYNSSALGLMITVETDKTVYKKRYYGMDFQPGNVYTMTITSN